MITKVSATFRKHIAKTEASRRALCGVEVYQHHPGDERHTPGECKTCARLAKVAKEK